LHYGKIIASPTERNTREKQAGHGVIFKDGKALIYIIERE
jgi:hypothetical protein